MISTLFAIIAILVSALIFAVTLVVIQRDGYWKFEDEKESKTKSKFIYSNIVKVDDNGVVYRLIKSRSGKSMWLVDVITENDVIAKWS